jgi:hypothetical protein
MEGIAMEIASEEILAVPRASIGTRGRWTQTVPYYDANFHSEEHEFRLPKMLLTGQEDLSARLLREGLDAGFDLALSNESRIDYSITCPDKRPYGGPGGVL